MEDFEFTYQQNYKKLFSFALKILGDKDLVNDVIQDVFINYYNKLQEGHIYNNPSGWLLKVTINECIDYTKKVKNYLSLDESASIIQGCDIEKKERAVLVKKALSNLSVKERTIILLYNDGYSYQEISELANVKFSSVGKTISRTLIKLKKLLKTYDHEMLR